MIESKYFEYIIVLANVGSIHKAADVLYISQPALSNSLKKLESKLGITLFERSASGVRPTPFCELMLPYVREILDKIELFTTRCTSYSVMQKYDLDNMTLTISAYPLLASVILPDVLSVLKIYLPQLEIISRNLDMKKAIPHPENLEIIIAFESNKNPLLKDGSIEKMIICPVKPVIFVHPDYIQSNASFMSEDELAKWPIFTVMKEYPFASVFTRSYIEYLQLKKKDLQVFDVANAATAAAFVRKKQGVSFGLQIGLFIPRTFSLDLVPIPLIEKNPEHFQMVLLYSGKIPNELIQLVVQILQNELIFNMC